jgi:hypothetical protein
MEDKIKKQKANDSHVTILNSLDDILLILGAHYVLKNQFYGVTNQEIFNDLECYIENFNINQTSERAMEIINLIDPGKLN